MEKEITERLADLFDDKWDRFAGIDSARAMTKERFIETVSEFINTKSTPLQKEYKYCKHCEQQNCSNNNYCINCKEDF